MNCTEFSAHLHDYVDGALNATDAKLVEAHVSSCSRCRGELDALKSLLAQTRRLPRSVPPAQDLWPALQFQLTAGAAPIVGFEAAQGGSAGKRSRGAARGPEMFRWIAPLGMAAAVVFAARFMEQRIAGAAWSVSATAGAPRIGAQTVRHEAKFRLGQLLETDAASRARVTVGSIGQVDVEPNSRLRLVGMAADDHRLEMSRGTMSAVIYAPPRLFFVNTPSATAVDLGCAYTLNVDDDGNGELRVSAGSVALEHGRRQSIIRFGMMCLTRRGAGPGTPFAVDAPEPLRTALARFDFEPAAASSALGVVLSHARSEDAVTLWHLLTRTTGPEQSKVYELLAKLAPPPAGVTRAGTLAGDVAMLQTWGTTLGLLRF